MKVEVCICQNVKMDIEDKFFDKKYSDNIYNMSNVDILELVSNGIDSGAMESSEFYVYSIYPLDENGEKDGFFPIYEY